jgi:16S rRNA (guanine966-N2)-methyltransferase
VRIISGIHRGRTIRPPSGFKARPTTDFAKESLFNILSHQMDFEGLDVLDLFAGTGSITYEFASRGARTVVAVEMNPLHSRFIRDTCKKLDMDMVNVIRTDVFKYLHRPYQAFDIVFADPPYDHPLLTQIPDAVLTSGILSENGMFIMEHPSRSVFSDHPGFRQHRKYGGVNFSFFA